MKELIRLKAQHYLARKQLVESLTELGYGVRIEEVGDKIVTINSQFYVIIYCKEETKV